LTFCWLRAPTDPPALRLRRVIDSIVSTEIDGRLATFDATTDFAKMEFALAREGV
jgi:hypothetical protein